MWKYQKCTWADHACSWAQNSYKSGIHQKERNTLERFFFRNSAPAPLGLRASHCYRLRSSDSHAGMATVCARVQSARHESCSNNSFFVLFFKLPSWIQWLSITESCLTAFRSSENLQTREPSRGDSDTFAVHWRWRWCLFAILKNQFLSRVLSSCLTRKEKDNFHNWFWR